MAARRGLVGLWHIQISRSSVLLPSCLALLSGRRDLWRKGLVEIGRIHHTGRQMLLLLLRSELLLTRGRSILLLHSMPATARNSRGSLLLVSIVHHCLHIILVFLGVRGGRWHCWWLHVVMGRILVVNIVVDVVVVGRGGLMILCRMCNVLIQRAIVWCCFMINIRTTTNYTATVLKLLKHSILVLLLGCLSSGWCRGRRLLRLSLASGGDPRLPWLGRMLLLLVLLLLLLLLLVLLGRVWLLLSTNHSYLLDHLGDLVSLVRDKLHLLLLVLLLLLVRWAVSCGGCERCAATVITTVDAAAASQWLHPEESLAGQLLTFGALLLKASPLLVLLLPE